MRNRVAKVVEFQDIKNKTENVFRPILQNALNSTHMKAMLMQTSPEQA